MKRAISVVLVFAAMYVLCWAVNTSDACTAIRVKTTDGSLIVGRSMEFSMDVHSNFIVIPRGKQYIGTSPYGKGLQWTTKYGTVGVNFFKGDHIFDGLNEKGLYLSALWLSDAKYQDVTPQEANITLSPTELGTWLLSKFSNVAEAKAGIKKIKVANIIDKNLKIVPPAHCILHDRSGDCAVIEYVDGKLNIHDNPLGVMTNEPPFDWQLTNLRNYVDLSPINPKPKELPDITLKPISMGAGLVGLPGDYTSPSRFVRTVVFTQAAEKKKTADEGVDVAIHIMNTFDIFEGVVIGKDNQEKKLVEKTWWITIGDLKNRRLYFRTYGNQDIRVINLNKLDFSVNKVRTIPMHEKPNYEDVTDKAK